MIDTSINIGTTAEMRRLDGMVGTATSEDGGNCSVAATAAIVVRGLREEVLGLKADLKTMARHLEELDEVVRFVGGVGGHDGRVVDAVKRHVEAEVSFFRGQCELMKKSAADADRQAIAPEHANPLPPIGNPASADDLETLKRRVLLLEREMWQCDEPHTVDAWAHDIAVGTCEHDQHGSQPEPVPHGEGRAVRAGIKNKDLVQCFSALVTAEYSSAAASEFLFDYCDLVAEADAIDLITDRVRALQDAVSSADAAIMRPATKPAEGRGHD